MDGLLFENDGGLGWVPAHGTYPALSSGVYSGGLGGWISYVSMIQQFRKDTAGDRSDHGATEGLSDLHWLHA